MSQTSPQSCSKCGTPLTTTSRFCTRCGALVVGDSAVNEILLPGGQRLRVSHDTLSIRELLIMVEAGVSWWQQQLDQSAGVNREHAATAMKDLSRILNSLSEQLAQGRETIRITTRLPVLRDYGRGCRVCGRGNRSGARFCYYCGTRLPASGDPAVYAPVPHLRLNIASRSDTGHVRSENEDTCYTTTIAAQGESISLLLVADGMGGAQAGAEASRVAGQTVKHELGVNLRSQVPADDVAWQQLLRAAVLAANRAVYTLAATSVDRRGMGTTLTVALVASGRVHLAHIGDSRAYLINAGGVMEAGVPLLQLTLDHTLVARLVDVGQLTPEQARSHQYRNMLYRALGTDPGVEVDTGSQPLRPGDVLLLCSDGLTLHVPDADLAQIVLEQAHPAVACDRLVALANQRGGHDNISVVVAKVEGK